VTDIELYSTTYFALLRAMPELEQWLGELEEVTIAGEGVSIRFVPDAISPLDAQAIGRLVSEFRGH
jgi:hypothetical protein